MCAIYIKCVPVKHGWFFLFVFSALPLSLVLFYIVALFDFEAQALVPL